MPYPALKLIGTFVLAGCLFALPGFASGSSLNPHLDGSLNLVGCVACHAGHGESRSPMLPASQLEVCNSCHGDRVSLNRQILGNVLRGGAEPPLLFEVLAQPYAHPLSLTAYSRREGEVTCTSCHSPHRSMAGERSGGPNGVRKLSPRDPQRFEFELCQECHGNAGSTTRNLDDVSRLFDLSNRSYHPVQATTTTSSPSVVPRLAGREINCTDCHGNSDPNGPRGPHGSAVPYLLRSAYTTADGEESRAAYALCYGCHNRELLFDESSPFPLHKMHVVDDDASCATCHSAHGSINNRALIRFGEETVVGGVAPSSNGRLVFESDMPGSGRCYLSCHGVDHDGLGYGLDMDPDQLIRRFFGNP